MVYPSSYLLPGLQNRLVAGWRRHRDSTFSPSWSSFFHHFSNTFFHRFWLHLGSQNGSKIHQKSIKNRSKNLIEKLITFGVDFSSIFDRFWTQLNFKKNSKNDGGLFVFHVFASSTSRSIPTCFWHRFCSDFSSILAPRSLPKCFKKQFEKMMKFWTDFLYWFLLDFGLHLGSHFP